jgi:hypothetical protein
MTPTRRAFLAQTAALGASLSGLAAGPRPPRVLLRNGWQTVNIGDIGHTPGALALLEKYVPRAEVRLWASKLDRGVDALLTKRFPNLVLLDGPDAVKRALAECDFLLHGSKASIGTADLARWKTETGKPYGVYGVTAAAPDAATLDVVNAAKFVFFRDSVSLKAVRDAGATCPVMAYGPDSAFAVDLRNDPAAEAYLKAAGLEPGKFLCCIGRLRYTPYWKIRGTRMTAEDDRKHARNEAMKEHDHAPLRAAIAAVVKETGLKVLLCPEDMSQMAVNKELIYDRLPADVKRGVVWREGYWLTDEALSVYVRSAGVFGNEMHSPIMAVGNGVPAVVCRFAEQTTKGLMWRDIGLGDWLFDLDEEKDRGRLPGTVLKLAADPAAAKATAAAARAFVRKRQAETMKVVADSLPG